MTGCIERDIYVLRDASCVAQPIEYVQGSNAVPILLHLRDYVIPEGAEARVYVEWPSTKGEYDNAVIEDNAVRIKVKDTMFSEVGKCFLQLCIVNGEDTLVSFRYPVTVKKNHVPGIAKPSENQSDFLEEYLTEINDKIAVTTQQVKDTAQAKEDALAYAGEAEKSAENAAESEANSLQYSKDSLASANASKASEEAALAYKNAASSSASDAEKSNQESKQSADDSAASAERSAQNEANALSYSESAKADAEQINGRIDLAVELAESALQSAENAETKSIIADEKAELAEQYAMMAESFTHGGTGARENEAVDNAQYFLEQAKQISQSMNGLIPMGTITFEELAQEENQVNKYMFNISNDFVTDDTFKEGAGHSYPAGVNVFRTNDGYWDCLAGSFQTPNGDTKDNVTAFVQASTRTNIASGEKHSVIFGKIAKFFADLKTVAFTGSYNDLSDKPSAGDVGAVATGGDVAENTVSYTEASTLAELVSGEKLKVTFGKLKLAVKNLIELAKLVGSVDISEIGDGTCTGAIDSLNSNLANTNKTVDELNTDLSTHTHKYAGSSSAGGAATSANKLNTNAGDSNTPVYFNSGVPVACTSLDLNTSGSSASCTGNAATATKLATARTVRTNLASTSTASFDGSGNMTPGVTGTLPIANGGTGATKATDARTNLGLGTAATCNATSTLESGSSSLITSGAVADAINNRVSSRIRLVVPDAAYDTATGQYLIGVYIDSVYCGTIKAAK